MKHLSLRSGRAAFWILQWWFEYAAQFRTGFRSRDCATSHLIRGGQRMQDSQAWPTMAAYRTHNVWQMYRTMQEQCIKRPANVSQAKDLALERLSPSLWVQQMQPRVKDLLFLWSLSFMQRLKIPARRSGGLEQCFCFMCFMRWERLLFSVSWERGSSPCRALAKTSHETTSPQKNQMFFQLQRCKTYLIRTRMSKREKYTEH